MLEIEAVYRNPVDGAKHEVVIDEVYKQGSKRYAKVHSKGHENVFFNIYRSCFKNDPAPMWIDHTEVRFDHLNFPYEPTTWWDVCQDLQQRDWSEQMRDEVPL